MRKITGKITNIDGSFSKLPSEIVPYGTGPASSKKVLNKSQESIIGYLDTPVNCTKPNYLAVAGLSVLRGPESCKLCPIGFSNNGAIFELQRMHVFGNDMLQMW